MLYKIVVKPGGTDGYMPPEQLKNQLKPCSDVYALGMTAIQALTGISPDQLTTDSQGEVAWQNQAKVSPKLAKILTKMVRFQFGQRYQSAKEVLNALEGLTPLNFTGWQNIIKPVTILLTISIVGILGYIIRNKIIDYHYEEGKKFLDKRDYDNAINSLSQTIVMGILK